MNQMVAGSIRAFAVRGISVYVHWTWFLLFAYLVQIDRGFSSPAWNVAVVAAIFGIVLLHEFGHALACRSVGGRAETIVLWPLGGVAYVQPPPRPGAVLWSLAAGPLVNVVLAPVTWWLMAATWGDPAVAGLPGAAWMAGASDDVAAFTLWLFRFNLIILIFNMLPIYPLDGGQIVHALLWYAIGYVRSLRIVAGLGLAVAIGGGVWALTAGRTWLVILAVFVAHRAWIGWVQAKRLAAMGHR